MTWQKMSFVEMSDMAKDELCRDEPVGRPGALMSFIMMNRSSRRRPGGMHVLDYDRDGTQGSGASSVGYA